MLASTFSARDPSSDFRLVREFPRPVLCRTAALIFVLGLGAAGGGGCRPPSGAAPTEPPTAPPTEPPTEPPPEASPPPTVGTSALSLVPSTSVPELSGALTGSRASLLQALNRSLLWFDKPSSRDFYPVAGVTHEWAQASVYAFARLVSRDESAQLVAGRIHQEFELHASVGSDGRGSVLFTGYYSPSFQGSLTPSSEYAYPLYRRPDDLVIEESSGEVLGRQVGGGDGFEPYPTRAQLLASGALEGLELVWLRDGFEAYTIQIQGSALIRLPDGAKVNVGYDGTNGRSYTSISLELVADGKLREDELSLPEVKDYFRRNPEALEVYARRNDRFVFFRVDSGENWPAGSLGLKVTPLRSLATDKAFFPPGAVVLVETAAPAEGGGTRRLFQFMLDQDTGGAIKSPGHADIYYGIGPLAEVLAGAQYAEGRLYYLLLRPERIDAWRRVMSSERAGGVGGAGSR